MMRKSYLITLHDVCMMLLAFGVALALRLGGDMEFSSSVQLPGMVVFTLATVVFFRLFRIPQRVWQYTSLQDLSALFKAIIVTLTISYVMLFLYNRLEGLPRSVIPIHLLVAFTFLGTPRILYRIWRNKRLSLDLRHIPKLQKTPVLLVGINSYSELFLRNTVGNPESPYRIVGIIAKDQASDGRVVHNVKVYGGIEHFGKILDKLNAQNKLPQKIIIAPDMFSGSTIKELLQATGNHSVSFFRLPRVTDFNPTDNPLQLRPILLEDLLGRPKRHLDMTLLDGMIRGKTVLITGCGGSIGSELCRQIVQHAPEQVVLIDLCEHNLYQIEHELSTANPDTPLFAYIADIRDAVKMEELFARYQPEHVFHAAALKHVPLCESNTTEAIRTNTFGTKIIADCCVRHQVDQMVFISTDKAVNPTSVMGATKRLAERYIQALGSERNVTTRFATIRFGNVLGSTGSVIPLFQKQLEQGGPLTVTDPNMKRYFMTVNEAVELVLYASSLVAGNRLESGDIFVLDMGDPVYIKDLAEQMIRLAGLIPYEDIEITFTGLRPGEKLFEELFHGKEAPLETEFEGILLANKRSERVYDVEKQLRSLSQMVDQKTPTSILNELQSLIPEYSKAA